MPPGNWGDILEQISDCDSNASTAEAQISDDDLNFSEHEQ